MRKAGAQAERVKTIRDAAVGRQRDCHHCGVNRADRLDCTLISVIRCVVRQCHKPMLVARFTSNPTVDRFKVTRKVVYEGWYASSDTGTIAFALILEDE